ncbi:MAG: type II toxin-antitoxin system HicB family antitoxin [Planctomycetaceae bacterium]|jgi:predicted RNase H-like HicB family nuclease|nr:type II toxin-antitoxin system HicB family antitoxin [Planctomycetaceae bacterium]
MKTTHFNVLVQREDDWYVAQCVDNFVASQGQSVEEALANLKEALELYYENEELPAKQSLTFLTSLEVAV